MAVCGGDWVGIGFEPWGRGFGMGSASCMES
jgi:hypothetical protein